MFKKSIVAYLVHDIFYFYHYDCTQFSLLTCKTQKQTVLHKGDYRTFGQILTFKIKNPNNANAWTPFKISYTHRRAMLTAC